MDFTRCQSSTKHSNLGVIHHSCLGHRIIISNLNDETLCFLPILLQSILSVAISNILCKIQSESHASYVMSSMTIYDALFPIFIFTLKYQMPRLPHLIFSLGHAIVLWKCYLHSNIRVFGHCSVPSSAFECFLFLTGLCWELFSLRVAFRWFAEPGPLTFQTLSGQHLTTVSSYLTHDPWNDLKRLLSY